MVGAAAVSDSRRTQRRRAVVVAAAVLCLLALMDLPLLAADPRLEELPERWRLWLEEEVYPLISQEQREAFLSLETEAQRMAYEDRLWVLWGRQTGYGASFRRVYRDRLEIARIEFNSTLDARARVLLIHGPPDLRKEARCNDVFNGLEIWAWQYIEGLGDGVVIVFYQPSGLGASRLWNAYETRRVLYTWTAWEQLLRARDQLERPEIHCFDGDVIIRLLASAEMWAKDPKAVQFMHHIPDQFDRGPESSSRRFMEFSALLPANAEPLDFAVTASPRSMRGGKVMMGVSVTVASEGLATTEVGDVDVIQLDVVGEISSATAMVDRFRYLYSVPSPDGPLGLRLERSLRPGEYTLRLKVEDTGSRKAAVIETPITVRAPTPEEETALAAIAGRPLPPQRAEGEVDEEPDEHSVIVLAGPEGEAVSGVRRFEAVAFQPVAKVTFLLNDREILTKNSPPFDIDLDLGPLPRLTTVSAVAFDSEGHELDRKQLTLNVGRERFFVRLQPLSPAGAMDGKVFVATEVNAPTDVALERLELYYNDVLVATLFQEPWAAWVDLSLGSEFGYLRALAVLADGSQAEDVQFVNAPRFGTVVDVTAVELPVVVLDSSGRPVENLELEDFTVLEDGVPQQITHFSLHRDLPVRLGIVIDTSGSMEGTLPEIQRVVMGFLRDLLRPRDRAFIETFADRPELLTRFTADFATLENALLALYADRNTALYDAVIMGLFQFSGVRGRRAIVVLTDGEDTVSRFDFDTVLDYARRSGVAVYCIGVDLPASKVRARYQLKKLSQETGGTAYFLPRKADLSRVYAEIDRELRMQYVLAYTSSSERPRSELREIEVKVNRPKVKVRTVSGYYPDSL